MKNLIKSLIQGGALALLTISLNANAQTHQYTSIGPNLPNGDFSKWKETCGDTYAHDDDKTMKTRPGQEPTGWNGSSVNQKVSMTKSQILVTNEDNTVKLENIYIGVNLGLTKIGSTAPGYITLGSPWVHAEMTVANCDGGTYGGAYFNYRPKSLSLRVKRTDTNAENSYVIAYLWNGTFKSQIGKKGSPSVDCDDVDRAILGQVSTTEGSDGKLVAKLEKVIPSTTNQDWQTITIPFEYNEEAGEPTKINVIICCGDYYNRGALKENTTLYVDDVALEYPIQRYTGKITTVNLTEDENAARSAEDPAWNDGYLTVVDYGNVIKTDDTGHKTTTGQVNFNGTYYPEAKLTHYDDYMWIDWEGLNEKIEGALHNNGQYLVHYDNTAANTRTKFVDANSATTGVEAIDGEAVKPIVFGGYGCVNVAGVHGMVSLYSLTGAKIAEAYVDGEAVIPASAGITVVAFPGGAVKCTVK